MKEPKSYWYAYECASVCRPGGVILDVCLDPAPDAPDDWHPEVRCPCCDGAMHFRTVWPSDRDGYGGGEDGGARRAIAEGWILRSVMEKLSIGQPFDKIELDDLLGSRDYSLLERLATRLEGGKP